MVLGSYKTTRLTAATPGGGINFLDVEMKDKEWANIKVYFIKDEEKYTFFRVEGFWGEISLYRAFLYNMVLYTIL